MYPLVITPDEADVLDANESERIKNLLSKGLRRHAALTPSVRAHGPLREVVIDPSVSSNHHPLGRGHNYHS